MLRKVAVAKKRAIEEMSLTEIFAWATRLTGVGVESTEEGVVLIVPGRKLVVTEKYLKNAATNAVLRLAFDAIDEAGTQAIPFQL